jgi:hypothetical protein
MCNFARDLERQWRRRLKEWQRSGLSGRDVWRARKSPLLQEKGALSDPEG